MLLLAAAVGMCSLLRHVPKGQPKKDAEATSMECEAGWNAISKSVLPCTRALAVVLWRWPVTLVLICIFGLRNFLTTLPVHLYPQLDLPGDCRQEAGRPGPLCREGCQLQGSGRLCADMPWAGSTHWHLAAIRVKMPDMMRHVLRVREACGSMLLRS